MSKAKALFQSNEQQQKLWMWALCDQYSRIQPWMRPFVVGFEPSPLELLQKVQSCLQLVLTRLGGQEQSHGWQCVHALMSVSGMVGFLEVDLSEPLPEWLQLRRVDICINVTALILAASHVFELNVDLATPAVVASPVMSGDRDMKAERLAEVTDRVDGEVDVDAEGEVDAEDLDVDMRLASPASSSASSPALKARRGTTAKAPARLAVPSSPTLASPTLSSSSSPTSERERRPQPLSSLSASSSPSPSLMVWSRGVPSPSPSPSLAASGSASPGTGTGAGAEAGALAFFATLRANANAVATASATSAASLSATTSPIAHTQDLYDQSWSELQSALQELTAVAESAVVQQQQRQQLHWTSAPLDVPANSTADGSARAGGFVQWSALPSSPSYHRSQTASWLEAGSTSSSPSTPLLLYSHSPSVMSSGSVSAQSSPTLSVMSGADGSPLPLARSHSATSKRDPGLP